MDNVSTNVSIIRTAIYGKDMRKAIADAIDLLNGVYDGITVIVSGHTDELRAVATQLTAHATRLTTLENNDNGLRKALRRTDKSYITWESGYIDTTTGENTADNRYVRSVYRYSRGLEDFLIGYNPLNSSLSYLALYKGTTFKGVYNSAFTDTLMTLDWNYFRVVIYISDLPNNYTDIHFASLTTLEKDINEVSSNINTQLTAHATRLTTLENNDNGLRKALRNTDKTYITWESGYINITTGENTADDRYVRSTQKYSRGYEDFLIGYNPLNLGLSYLALYKGTTFKGVYNSSFSDTLTTLDWNYFRVVIYISDLPNYTDIHFASLTTLEKDISDVSSDVNNKLLAHTTQLTAHTTRITTLENNDNGLRKALRNTDKTYITWESGYINITTGENTADDRYVRSTQKYSRGYEDFLIGYNPLNLGLSYLALYKGTTFKGVYNSASSNRDNLSKLDWDSFRIVIYISDLSDYANVHFASLTTIENEFNSVTIGHSKALRNAVKMYITWESGYIDITTGEITADNRYVRSVYKFSRGLEDFLIGYNPLNSSLSYLALYKGDTFKGVYNSSPSSRDNLSKLDWDNFAIVIFISDLPNYANIHFASLTTIENEFNSVTSGHSKALRNAVKTYIRWESGYIDIATGENTADNRYVRSTQKYSRGYEDFLIGYNPLNSSLCYLVLYKGDTFKGVYNSASSNRDNLSKLDWDSFRIVIYISDLSDYANIHFASLTTIENDLYELNFNDKKRYIDWQNGFYDPEDGGALISDDRYMCSVYRYPKAYMNYLIGWKKTSYCYFALYKGNTYVSSTNAINPYVLASADWDNFACVVYISDIPDYKKLHFMSVANVDSTVEYSLSDQPSSVQWKQGYYDIETGEYEQEATDMYACSKFLYPRECFNRLRNWNFASSYDFIILYKDNAFVRMVNGGVRVPNDDSWDSFTLTAYLQEHSSGLSEIYFYSLVASNSSTPKEIEVSTATELIDAVQVAIDDEYKGLTYNIRIKEGTYELWTALDRSKIYGSGDQLYHRGLELPNKCNLIGIGNVTLSCTIPESDNSDEHKYTRIVSTLNIHGTENLLENITFVGNNTRYCIHDDSGFYDHYNQLTVRNCHFIHNGSESALYMPTPMCYGAGYTSGRKALFENCVFECHGTSNTGIYAHTHKATYCESDSELVIDSCAFLGSDKRGIFYQVVTDSPYGGIVTVKNCYFEQGNVFQLAGQAPDEESPSTRVFGGGNTGLTIDNQIHATMYLH